MKFLVLIAVIYAIYNYSTLFSQAGSFLKNRKEKEQINPSDDDHDGEYVDYEEVED